MSPRFANRRFAPSVLATILAVIGVAAFVKLGLWQLDRAEQKRALLAQYAEGRQSTITLTAENADTLPRYQQVRARGHYDPAHQVLLDNMWSERGGPGYRVLTPFELEQGDWLLVDRGWMSMGATRSEIPDVSVGGEMRSVVGRLDELPRAAIRLDSTRAAPAGNWPRVMNYPQHAALEEALGRSLRARRLLLDPAQPDGYERVSQLRLGSGAERHLGYAVQWFAFALAALVIYVVLGFRKRATNDKGIESG